MSIRVVALAFLLAITGCGHKKNGGGADAPGTGTDSGIGSGGPVCSNAGSACMANTDCCTTSCINGSCSSMQCTADGAQCSGNGECCGGNCSNGTCAPLNATCKTNGNPCTANTD